jgi:hypothetical protein
MLVLYSILLILLIQTDLLIGHVLMAENDRAIWSGDYAIIPYVSLDILNRNGKTRLCKINFEEEHDEFLDWFGPSGE